MIGKVYIAAPFFNPQQLEMVTEIEFLLENFDIDYFSPRKHGVIKEMDEEGKNLHMGAIYSRNILELRNCDLMIAIIDDYDSGTMFEIGYFTSQSDNSPFIESNTITFTGKDHGLNVMLGKSVDCHIKSMENLDLLLSRLIVSRLNDEALKFYNSAPEITT